MGLLAICAQAIFVRETMSLFTGTEFVIGIVLAAWLLWVGLGGLVGGMFLRHRRTMEYRDFAIAGIAAALLLPLTVVAIRFARSLIAQPPGSFPPVSHAILISIVLIAPFGFLYGAIYNIASLLWGGGDRGLKGGVSRVYIWEALGSLGGAFIFAFILVSFLSHLGSSVFLALLVIAVLLLGDPVRESALPRIAIFALFALIAALVTPKVDSWTMGRIFAGYRIEDFRASRYGEVVAASRAELLSFYQGGSRLFSVPEPERAEEIVHIPMLIHPEPHSVLLIGGCLGGGWQEAVKHPSVESVDCLELDGELLSMVSDMGAGRIGALAGGELDITFVQSDGRRYLSRTDRKYDVILLVAPPPLNLQWNRYYTVEFFSLVEESLEEGGIFGFTHPSSENFLSDAQAEVLSILMSTMEEVYDEVLLLPGSVCHIIGGAGPLDTATMLERLHDRGISTDYVSAEFLPFRFSRERIETLRRRIMSEEGSINSDTKPILPIREIALEGDRIGSGLLSGIELLGDMPQALPAGVLGGLLLIILTIGRRKGAPGLAVGAVGLGSFLLQLIVLLSYQAFSGLLYHAIVLLTAIFMAGAAAGAYVSMKRKDVTRAGLSAIHGGFILIAVIMLSIHTDAFRSAVPYEVLNAAYFALAGITGALTGAYYPLVVRTALRERGRTVPAFFYAWDLFGACLGGSIGGMILFPLIGLGGTLLFIAGIHLAVPLLLVGRW
jgi:spermidine synthase